MGSRSTLLLCGTTLVLGMAIGLSMESWPLSTPVQANALDAQEAEQLYEELGKGSGALIEGSRHLAKIAKLTTPSVVHIQSERRSPGRGTVEETGSGVIMSSPKMAGLFVVTNRHVINEAGLDSIFVHLYDGRVVKPTYVWNDKATDIAVLKIPVDDLPADRWGDSDQLGIGHMVLAMGSPFGLSQSVTYGIISAKGRRSLRLGSGAEVLNQDFLQTDAAINPGNSGGPLIDLHGRVIGINTAIASNSGGNDGIGFSIPSNLVRRVVDQLLEHGKVQRAYLGVKLDPDFNLETAQRLQLDRSRGARILEIYPNTPASRANLKYDDVVVNFDGIDVHDENHLINLVSLTPVNKRVRLVVMRDGRRLTLHVSLGDRSELEQRSEAVPLQPGMGIPVEPMGLALHPLSGDLSDQLGFQRSATGLLVLKVEPFSPLSEQVHLYDLIVEAARTPISSIDDLERVLIENESSDSVLLKVKRRIDGRSEDRVIIWQR